MKISQNEPISNRDDSVYLNMWSTKLSASSDCIIKDNGVKINKKMTINKKNE